MRVIELDAPARAEERPLRLRDRPVPEPGAGELLVRVRACAVCRTDLHIVEGDLPSHLLPVVPGHQVVGTVERLGPPASNVPDHDRRLAVGERVGVPWLHRTDGDCRPCRAGRENLCERATFTGWDVNGGYAEYLVAPAAFVYRIPEQFSDEQAAPLLCAGIIGYRALRLTGLLDGGNGGRLGLYGFGGAAHILIQVAVARGIDVYVCTRDQQHRGLGEQLGARWAGGAEELPPASLDAAIIFAPAGSLVPVALQAVDRGGSVVCAGIHMSPIPAFPYADLYWERQVRSVANNTRDDGERFLAEAAHIGLRTHVETYALEDAGEALLGLKHGDIKGGSAVLLPG